MRMPRKKRMVLMSMRVSRCVTRFAIGSLSSKWRLKISVTVHSTPKTSRMPIYGGRWVMVLKMGTKMRPPTPRQNTAWRWCFVKTDTSPTCRFCALSNLPFSESDSRKAGTTIDTSEGMNSSVSTPPVDTMPLIHSMMVVTSPIGEKAPPLLAATITIEAKMSLSFGSCISLRSTMIITIEVVRLSRMAERKNVINATRHSSLRFERVFIVSRTKLKPPLASTISTMVMAPMRKNSVSAVSPRLSGSDVRSWPGMRQ